MEAGIERSDISDFDWHVAEVTDDVPDSGTDPDELSSLAAVVSR